MTKRLKLNQADEATHFAAYSLVSVSFDKYEQDHVIDNKFGRPLLHIHPYRYIQLS